MVVPAYAAVEVAAGGHTAWPDGPVLLGGGEPLGVELAHGHCRVLVVVVGGDVADLEVRPRPREWNDGRSGGRSGHVLAARRRR